MDPTEDAKSPISINGRVDLNSCQCNDMGEKDYSAAYAMYNYIVVMILLPAVAAFGVFSNLINSYIFTRPPLRASVNVYLLGLSCSDLLVVSTGAFVFFSDSVRVYAPSFTHVATQGIIWVLPLGFIAQTCSVYFTVAAAADCYVKVCWRRLSEIWCTSSKAKIFVLLITAFSVAYNGLRFWQFRLNRCWDISNNSSKIEFCPTELYDEIEVVYNVYMYMILMTVLPFMLLSFLNVLIVRTVHQIRRMNTLLRSTCVERAAAQTNGLLTMRQELPFNRSAGYCDRSLNYRTDHKLSEPCYSDRSSNYRSDHKHSSVSYSDRSSRYFVDRVPSSMSYSDRFSPQQYERKRSSLSLKLGSPAGDDSVITMVMVVILFLACNTLALIVNIVETFFDPDPLVVQYMTDTSNLLVVLNSAVNYVIYMLFDGVYLCEFKNCIIIIVHRIRSIFARKEKQRRAGACPLYPAQSGPLENTDKRRRHKLVPGFAPTASISRSKSLSEFHVMDDEQDEKAMLPLMSSNSDGNRIGLMRKYGKS